MTARKSKTWAVILSTPGGPIRTEHRSQAEADRKVAETRAAVAAGISRVSRIRVEQWNAERRVWTTYALINPKED